jgi:hypothetical protein
MATPQKDEFLADWHERIDSRRLWVNPLANYRYLKRLADRMLEIGAIDPLERFDMVDRANAAFCYFIEEAPMHWRHPASDYDVYNACGHQVGSLQGNRYFLHGAGAKPGPMDFFAQVQEAGDKLKVVTRSYQPYGELIDRHIHTETGQKLTLVERGRLVEGVHKTRLDDPDCYRATIDAAMIALEEANIALYIELWEKENFSIFLQCSACCDRFYLREDCEACRGRGFTEDPECPSKLPLAMRGPPGSDIEDLYLLTQEALSRK